MSLVLSASAELTSEAVRSNQMKITIETIVRATMNKVWNAWNAPADILRWNAAQDDWHTTHAGAIVKCR
jgi:uncharacterized protein YndB with AHSA1/START domain